jgi:isoleucyl-tRNA synthetase
MGVHHAWGRTLKDVYQRYRAMNGRKQRYQNGFDCQGLWVEVEVEKELDFKSKKDIEDYGIDRFVQKCKERVNKYSDMITLQSKRLGFWMDWDDSYYTMSDENNYTIWTFLKKAHDRGFLYKGHDVMPWCPRCGTGISQHEMQEGYKDTQHLSVIVRFPIKGRSHQALLVWTTTPWTLTSNVAVAVNPDLPYLKVKQQEWTYYLIKERAETVLKEHGPWKTLEELPGSELMARAFTYTGPFDQLPAQQEVRDKHRVIAWKEVSESEGTGIVHIAPGCGAEDFVLGKEFDLPIVAPLDENGRFIDGFDWLSGKAAGDAADAIKNDLSKKKLLYSSEQYPHSYPHCWRCSHELLFRLVDEWFIAMDPWRDEIKNVARKIQWIPSFGLDLELDWLSNMRDWLISKKRYWGLALPIWECHACRHFTVIGSRGELKDKAVEGWETFEGHSPHRPWVDSVKILCPNCGTKISRIPDVGNPWLDAGIVPYSTVKYNSDREYWQEWMPADLVLECFPGQFRNWFYSLLAMSTMMENIPPFKTLVGHALVRDEKGEEMHKSKGNAIWFDDAAEKIGVEVMRWIFCSHEMTTNLNFGYESARLIRGKFINTLWNSYAFFVNYARLIDFKVPRTPVPVDQRPDFDRWILSGLHMLIETCRKHFETYNVRPAAGAIDEFLEVLSNWYIRSNRRRFWRSELDTDTRSAFETLFDVMDTVLHLLAPILPLLTEEMYRNLVLPADSSRPESIHLNEYPTANSEFMDRQLVTDMDHIVKLNALALSAREKARLKIRQPLAVLIITPNSKAEAGAVKRFSHLLESQLNVKRVELRDLKTPCPLDLEVRPSKKFLGQKYRAKANAIAEEIERQSNAIGQSLRESMNRDTQQWQYAVEVDGETIRLAREDFLIEEKEPENLSLVTYNDGWLAFDTTLSEPLLLEGLMRDFLRRMQVFRKESGLEIEDRITMSYHTDSSRAKTMMTQFKDTICSELLCLEMKEEPFAHSPHVIDLSGETIGVTIQKVS